MLEKFGKKALEFNYFLYRITYQKPIKNTDLCQGKGYVLFFVELMRLPEEMWQNLRLLRQKGRKY